VSRVLPEVFRPVYHESLASKEIYPVRNTFSIDLFSCAFLKIFSILEACTVLNAALKHLTRLLTEWRVLLMVRLKVPLPQILDNVSTAALCSRRRTFRHFD
jgi:hypothetical protein